MPPIPTIALNDGQRFRLLKLDDIIYLGAEGSYTNVHLDGGEKIVISRNLKSISANLPEDLFLRIHHSCVVNLAHSVSFHNGNTSRLEMSNGQKLSVSRTRKHRLMERFVQI